MIMKKLKHQLKRHSFGMAIICILLVAVAVFGGFSVFAQQRAEQSVTNYQDRSQETLFKNYIYSAKTVKAVCDKYGLDYDTVTVDEVFADRDRLDYTYAVALKLENGANPLLSNGESTNIDSLEVYLNEVYAFDGGREIIEEACEKYKISAKDGKISDFTIKQLIEIGKQAYETSPHPH